MADTGQRDALAPVPHPPVAERAGYGRSVRARALAEALDAGRVVAETSI